MYDIAKLQRNLPYCTKIDFESHDNVADRTQRVFVICHYAGGMIAQLECKAMPPSTDALAELVAAGAAQCLAATVIAGKFTAPSHRKGMSKARIIRRDGGNGRPSVEGDRLLGPSGAPEPREVMLTMQDVITVDGVETSTTDHQLHNRHRTTWKQPASLPPPPPPPERLDPVKARRASDAMAKLMNGLEDD